MLTTNAQVPKNAIPTSHLAFQQLQELAVSTSQSWLTPVEALSREDAILLSIHTEHLFPWVAQPSDLAHITTNCYRVPVSTRCKPLVQRWSDRLEEDDSLPDLPASWKR
jgi:hypothetical protein